MIVIMIFVLEIGLNKTFQHNFQFLESSLLRFKMAFATLKTFAIKHP